MPLQPKQQPPYYEQGHNVKIYTAIITQTGTSAPTATVLYNTIGNIVWARAGIGDYTATLNGAFTLNKTWINGMDIDLGAGGHIALAGATIGEAWLSIYRGSANVLQLGTILTNQTPVEWSDYESHMCIEIRVYNT